MSDTERQQPAEMDADNKEQIREVILELTYMAARLPTLGYMLDDLAGMDNSSVRVAAEAVAEARDETILNHMAYISNYK